MAVEPSADRVRVSAGLTRTTERTLHRAAEEWIAAHWPPGSSDGTAYQYGLTMRRIAERVDPDRAREVAGISGEEYAEALRALWGAQAANTFNRNRITVLSFINWAREKARWTEAELPATCPALAVKKNRTLVVDRETDLDPLWDPDRFALRERALWRGLYESASRASAFLALDVPDLDFRRKRARARLKGGDTDWLYFEDSAADLLAELVEGRERGPVFLTNRRPRNWRCRPTADFAPDGRRCRLSYDRAAQVFKKATRAIGFTGEEALLPDFEYLTLHAHRKARLTHLAEEGWSAPMLQQLSKHESVHVLQEVYVRPSGAAVERALRKREKIREETLTAEVHLS